MDEPESKPGDKAKQRTTQLLALIDRALGDKPQEKQ